MEASKKASKIFPSKVSSYVHSSHSHYEKSSMMREVVQEPIRSESLLSSSTESSPSSSLKSSPESLPSSSPESSNMSFPKNQDFLNDSLTEIQSSALLFETASMTETPKLPMQDKIEEQNSQDAEHEQGETNGDHQTQVEKETMGDAQAQVEKQIIGDRQAKVQKEIVGDHQDLGQEQTVEDYTGQLQEERTVEDRKGRQQEIEQDEVKEETVGNRSGPEQGIDAKGM